MAEETFFAWGLSVLHAVKLKTDADRDTSPIRMVCKGEKDCICKSEAPSFDKGLRVRTGSIRGSTGFLPAIDLPLLKTRPTSFFLIASASGPQSSSTNLH